ncbi:WD40 repeat [Dillenia turbinata]|uniref:WD40 repeat n=1 Tax=Dillenia turbinata TaxID=194707 RepID=A0AAN8V913_9MAGN
MSACDEGDVFFDSLDRLSSDSSDIAREDLVLKDLDLDIWMNQPGSVQERRERFFNQMGLSEFGSFSKVRSRKIDSNMALERIRECSGAVSTSLSFLPDGRHEMTVCSDREVHNGANSMVEFDHGRQCIESEQTVRLQTEARRAREDACEKVEVNEKKNKSWFKKILSKRIAKVCMSEVSVANSQVSKTNEMEVQNNKKRYKELTAMYLGQEIQAHKGFIWTMKFSPDGQYLASGGEDGVVRIWGVASVNASDKNVTAHHEFGNRTGESMSGSKKSRTAEVMIPEKIFQIEKLPLQEFYGHVGGVLDLAWSKSNILLSSSKDKTVRLWNVGCNECLRVFPHNNYVTCIQFNPLDENYFISGSVDGKARIWGVSEGRVVNWADVRDIITAICYRPDGKGFVVGSVRGSCRFYEVSANNLQLDVQINFQGRKKTSLNRITGIQFTEEESPRVIVTSEDSKLRILDGIDVVHKFKGLRKSGSQMSASFTPSGRHIISVGEDSRVYLWIYDSLSNPPSKQKPRSVCSCEHFFFQGVSVALPWSGTMTNQTPSDGSSPWSYSQTQDHHLETASWLRESGRFSLGSWFSMEGPCRASATWPEEKLPLCDMPIQEDNQNHSCSYNDHKSELSYSSLSATWGLVIVTASWDGKIRTFHNYGLPMKV